MSYRNTKYLDNKRIVYRRDPITDKPTVQATYWDYYENGTYECYQLFRSRAKITTYKSLKWHLLVLWYLNPQLDQEEFTEIADVISSKEHGFTTFKIHPEMTRRMVYEISMLDIHDAGKRITATQLALWLECSTRTIHRNMGEELKREKELLNKQL